MSLLGACSLFLLCVAVPVSTAPIPSGQDSSSIAVESDGVKSSNEKPQHSTLIRRDTEPTSSNVVDVVVDQAGEVSDDSDTDLQLKQHLAKKRPGTDFASEFAMRETRSAAEETLLKGEAEANLLDERVYHEGKEETPRAANGCLVGKEEFYGNRCYKKCSTFGFEASGTGNGGYAERVAPNACRKDSCLATTEDNFGNNCYKACADLVADYPIRKGSNKCSKTTSGWGVNIKTSDSYNVGIGGAPRRILDVAGGDCPDTTACCKGYNVNDDPTKATQCPYIPVR